MSTGATFRRCTRKGCQARWNSDESCPRCGGSAFEWVWRADVAPKEAPRKQRTISRDDDGQRFRTKKAAEAHMHAVLASVGRGAYVEPSRMTVAQFFDAWVSGGCNGVRASTLRSYAGAAKHIKLHLGSVPLQSLTRAHLRGFYGALRRDGARLNGRPGRIAERTIAKFHIAITSALNQAVQDKLITANPAAAAAGARKSSQLVAPAETRSRRPTWSDGEVQAFLAAVANDRDHALYRTALATGLRMSELLGLTWLDVDVADPKNAWLHVRQQWTEEDAMEDGEDFSAPKTDAGIRDIDLDVGTAEILRSQQESQRFDRRRWGDDYRDRQLVFARPNGEALDHDALRKRFTRRVRKTKMRLIRFHDLRHTHATLLREEGVDMQVISRRLGHSSETVTYRLYGHVTPKLSRTAATAIGNLIDGTRPSSDRPQGAPASEVNSR